MSVDLNSLSQEFGALIEDLLTMCADEGVIMQPYTTVRDPFQQARLWSQSRTNNQIRQEIANLRWLGADFLASCLELAGPQIGPLETNVIPGLSWHQWGEAIDCVWMVNGKPYWLTDREVNGINGYIVYSRNAEKLGLTSGKNISGLKDFTHVQLRPYLSPLKAYSLEEVEEEMKQRFGYLIPDLSDIQEF